MSAKSTKANICICLFVTFLLSTFSAHAMTASYGLDGLLAVMIGFAAIVPLVLLKFSISRVKSGLSDKKVILLALPGAIFLILLVIMFISIVYQGYLFGIDGIFKIAFLIYSSWRIWVLIDHLRTNSQSKVEAEKG